MTVLSSSLRRVLESGCVAGRHASEGACRAALGALGVGDDKVPGHLNEPDRVARRGLRAKSRQLGDVTGSLDLLVAECAFEQWHRLLFARFLAENGLLIHPEFGAPVTLVECDELAEALGEADGWAVAGRFAAEILPGIFQLDDPCVQLRLAPEGRLELEGFVEALPAEVFTADDSLGWVYQFWQKEKKDGVNASERKIGGADLGPVTQLFTENYMVRFLLENSLGAWWATRHPDSPLLKDWEFLRFADDGTPAARAFDGWPATVAEVTVMDPCCGSGHFLVEAFSMLWQMRAEEEGLGSVTAQDAVLRDNLFGLELDPRCVQIAMFAVAMAAWKGGAGWRQLPVPNVACSGIPVKAPVQEWKALAGGDAQLENALVRLHILFRDADTLGSLIDPKRAVELTDPAGLQASFEDVDWDDIAPLLADALTREDDDPAIAVLGADAAGIARATDYLSRHYTLIATNVPYLGRASQGVLLSEYGSSSAVDARWDLATLMFNRLAKLTAESGVVAAVMPQSFLVLDRYDKFRKRTLREWSYLLVGRLGARAFESVSGEVVNVCLALVAAEPSSNASVVGSIDALSGGPHAKYESLRKGPLGFVSQQSQLQHPGAKIMFSAPSHVPYLGDLCDTHQGIATSDGPRFVRNFWELGEVGGGWEALQSAPENDDLYAGRSDVIYWEDGFGAITEVCQPGAPFRGQAAWNRLGIAVAQMSRLTGTLYTGDRFDGSAVVLSAVDAKHLPALWAFVKSGSFSDAVRKVDTKLRVSNTTMRSIPFDVDHWLGVAAEQYPDGLPEPWSDDPTQWLFEGRPEVATEPLQVGVGRLVGYRWPEQAESDDLDGLADEDGIVCLPSVLGERSAADRLTEVLARAFGGTWSPARTGELLEASGSKKKDLEVWLRDEFFKAHCSVFKNRPFVWHVWDGRKDGFAALVNYHRLDRAMLERLTYAYLGAWIERQSAGVREDVPGAEERLGAAQDLQRRLELILEGERPFDIYVRWKTLEEQPMGWDPDLNDGVRLNVRPFVEAGVLRSKFNVKWEKDRGKNPDGSERFNDLHPALAGKEAARLGNHP